MTEEMKAIINAPEKHIAINAYAGCTKSSTMLEYIKAHPNENITFLVYNKSMEMEFKQRAKDTTNANISTIHSLAYKWFTNKYRKRAFKNISVVDVKNVLKSRMEYSQLSLIKFYYDMYLCSDVEDPRELQTLSDDDKHLLPFVKRLFDYYVNSDTIQHNVYLKLFQLSKEKIDCDTLIVDEFNDVNMCMLSIVVNNLDKKVLVVGDSLQNLNSFNYTVDGLSIMIKKYKFKEYSLTMSFRVSEDVASVASRYLSYMYDDTIRFHGNKHTKFAKIDLTRATKDNQVHLLCRNRLGGLIEVLKVLSVNKNKKFYYVGGIDSFGLKDIERIHQYNGTIYIGGEKFHISQLRKMLNDDIKDPEISKAVSLYDFGKKYDEFLPLLRFAETTNKDEADIIVQTAHSSKGLTVKNVYLASDFKPIEIIKKEMLLMKESGNEYLYNVSKSEINLLYVGMTRPTELLDLNQVLNRTDKRDNLIEIESESDVILKR
jgi:superfamily I DNA/RNA helicase